MKNSWGIVISISAFLIQFFMDGICLSFGIYVIELQKEFDAGLSIISSIGSVHFGFQLCTGPVASFLMQKISYRKVCLLGSLLSSIGLSVLPFTPNIPYLIVFFGVLTGIGYCLLYLSSHTLSGLWFDENRSLVTGIVTSGSSLGGVVFPPLVKLLIDEYGWRGSMFILAALNLQTILLSGLLRESPMQRSWKKSRTKCIKNDLTRSTVYTIPESNGNHNHTREKISENTTGNHNAKNESSIDDEGNKSRKGKFTVLKLIKNIPYVLFTINCLLWNVGASVHLLLGPDYFTKVGRSVSEAAILLSVSQGTACFGSVLGGILGNYRHINRCVLFLSTNLIAGLCLLAYPLQVLHTMVGLTFLNFLYGLCLGVTLGLLVILVSDFVGSQLIADGMGYLMLLCGVGFFLGPPFGGYLVQLTESDDMVYYFAGSAYLLSAVVLMVIPINDCLRRSKKYAVSMSVT